MRSKRPGRRGSSGESRRTRARAARRLHPSHAPAAGSMTRCRRGARVRSTRRPAAGSAAGGRPPRPPAAPWRPAAVGAGGLGGQRLRELVAAPVAVLSVLALVGLGGLPQDLGHLGLELVVGAVGPLGGVGGHLGVVQRNGAEPDHPRPRRTAARTRPGIRPGQPCGGLGTGRWSLGPGSGCQPGRGRRRPRGSAARPAGRSAPRSRGRTAARRAAAWGGRRGGRARRCGALGGTLSDRAGRPRPGRTRPGARWRHPLLQGTGHLVIGALAAGQADGADPLGHPGSTGKRIAAAGGEADHREALQAKPVGQGLDVIGPAKQGRVRTRVRAPITGTVHREQPNPGRGGGVLVRAQQPRPRPAMHQQHRGAGRVAPLAVGQGPPVASRQPASSGPAQSAACCQWLARQQPGSPIFSNRERADMVLACPWPQRRAPRTVARARYDPWGVRPLRATGRPPGQLVLAVPVSLSGCTQESAHAQDHHLAGDAVAGPWHAVGGAGRAGRPRATPRSSATR
jgi:hypothetical protein